MNELVPVSGGQNQVMFYTARGLNHDAILAKLDEEMPAGGGLFPGDALTFNGKKGVWVWGFGKNAQQFDHRKSLFVFNMPNAAQVWQRFITEGTKMFPHFEGLTYFADTKKFPTRDSLGDADPDAWATNNFGKKDDPWKECVAVPVRIVGGGDDVQHLFLSAISGVIAFKTLMRKWAEQGRSNLGKLPVVALGVEQRKRKDRNESFEVPTFEIVDWVDPVAADLPEGMDAADTGSEIPEGSVSAQTRDTVSALEVEVNKSAAAQQETVNKIAANAGARPAPQARPSGLFANSAKKAPARI